MLPEEHRVAAQGEIRRHAECGIPAAKDRDPLSRHPAILVSIICHASLAR
jgi:hypothetical protein